MCKHIILTPQQAHPDFFVRCRSWGRSQATPATLSATELGTRFEQLHGRRGAVDHITALQSRSRLPSAEVDTRGAQASSAPSTSQRPLHATPGHAALQQNGSPPAPPEPPYMGDHRSSKVRTFKRKVTAKSVGAATIAAVRMSQQPKMQPAPPTSSSNRQPRGPLSGGGSRRTFTRRELVPPPAGTQLQPHAAAARAQRPVAPPDSPGAAGGAVSPVVRSLSAGFAVSAAVAAMRHRSRTQKPRGGRGGGARTYGVKRST